MKAIRVADIDINYAERGMGVPLLLVHGFPLDYRMWQPQLDELSASARVIAPDLRGFGRTTVTDDVSMERLADDLALFVRTLGIREPIVFCGLSMGGYVAWQFWRKHRDLVRALILCDTKASPDTPDAAANRRKMAEHVLEKGTSIVAEAMLPKMFEPETVATNPGAVAYVREVILHSSPKGIAAAQRGLAERIDARPLLATINVPSLVIVGEHDAISPPEEMRTVADAIPGSKLVIVPAAGHMAPLEAPEPVNNAIREFLGGVQSSVVSNQLTVD
jgi:pimeloyl-ACP methyl ester carboxylesterase